MKLTLTKVGRFTKDKDGNPLMSKTGRPYTRLRVQAEEYGAKWISGFDNETTRSWKEGDTVEADVEENGEYLNLKTAKKQVSGCLTDNDRYLIKQASESAYAANVGIQQLAKALRDAGVIKDPTKFVGNTDVKYPDEVDPADMPF